MKKLLLGLVLAIFLILSFDNAPAWAGCNQVINTGIGTTNDVFWHQPPAYYGWSGGVVSNNMYFNGCGSTVAIKINTDDWERLRSAGKLDGLRYIRYDGATTINLRKMVGTQPTDISQDKFFDGTTLVYKGRDR